MQEMIGTKEEKNVGDSTEIVIKTPYKQSYIDERYNIKSDVGLC